MRERSRPGAAAVSAGAVIPYTPVQPNAKDDSIATHPGHRRRRLPRLAPVRAPARAGARRALRRQLLHRRASATSRTCSTTRASSSLRHDVTFPLYVEVDEIYNLACPASPIHYQFDPVQTTKTSRARRDQHARPRQAPAGARSCRPRPARSTATPRCTRRPRTTGATSTRSARAPATTRASAAPRRCSSTTTASTGSTIKVARIFNTYGPRMHAQRRPRGVELHRAGAARRADHDLRRRQPDALVLLRRRPGRGAGAADGRRPTTSPGRSTSATPPSSPSGQLAERVIALTGSRSKIEYRPLPAGRPEAASAGHRARAGDARLGADHAARGGARQDGRVLRPAAQERRGHAGSLPAPRRRLRACPRSS